MEMEKSDEEENTDEDEKDLPVVDLTGSEAHPTSKIKLGRGCRVLPKIQNTPSVKEKLHSKPYR